MTRGQKPDSRKVYQHLTSGIVRIRLAGAAEDVEMVASVIARNIDVIERSHPYANRNGPGDRVHLLVKLEARGPQ